MAGVHTPLSGPFVWSGAEIERDRRWVRRLDPAHVDEIEAALRRTKARGIDWRTLGREEFTLPTLEPVLAGIRGELEEGRGIALLRGFPVERFTENEIKTAFFGIGLHLGAPVYQNARGERLREIRDEGDDRGALYGEVRAGEDGFLSSRARVASTGELRFHTDRADVVALLCARPARAGGLTRIASSAAVHNELLKRRPDLLEALFSPYPRSRFGEEARGNDAWYMLPIMGNCGGKFTSHYSRTYIEAAELIDAAPRLSHAQREAMELLAETASELSITMHFEAGDVQFLNSHVTYHARTAYEDYAEASKKRLLYRLWLCPPENRPLPADHAVLWGDTRAGGLRGGISQA